MTQNDNDILNKAIADVKAQPAAGPPQALVDQTIARLTEAAEAPLPTPYVYATQRIWPLARLAAAAAILLFVGFSFGRAPRREPLDLAQLEEQLAPSIAAALEPALRERLTDEVTRRYELALANGYHRIRQELTEQHRDEMNRLAVQTLAASSAVTNRLLADLMDNIKTEQTRDLRSVAAALRDIDRRRIAEQEILTVDLATLADQVHQTKSELVQLLVHERPPQFKLYPPQSANDPNERSPK